MIEVNPSLLLVFGPAQSSIDAIRGVQSYWDERGIAASYTTVALPSLEEWLNRAGKPVATFDAVIGYLTPEIEALLGPEQVAISVVHRLTSTSRLISLAPNSESIGIFAANYLHGLGYRNFATFGNSLVAIRKERYAAFAEQIARLGGTYHQYTLQGRGASPQQAQSALLAWLNDLPRPVAIFVHQDRPARYLIRFCNKHTILPAPDIAVLGVDNSAFYCTSIKPTLSSIAIPTYSMGRHASQLCHRLLCDSAARREELPDFGPTHVICRESTPSQTLTDPLVRQALRLIDPRRKRALTVGQLAERLQVSPKNLNNRFKATTGLTPGNYLHRERIEFACELLDRESTSITDIAKRCHYKSIHRFEAWFKRLIGRTPSQFRRFGRGEPLPTTRPNSQTSHHSRSRKVDPVQELLSLLANDGTIDQEQGIRLVEALARKGSIPASKKGRLIEFIKNSTSAC